MGFQLFNDLRISIINEGIKKYKTFITYKSPGFQLRYSLYKVNKNIRFTRKIRLNNNGCCFHQIN